MRHRERTAGLRNKSAISCLWEHCRDVHNLEVPNFQMNVIKRYKNDTMFRQIMEAVKIEAGNKEELMNDKFEWNYVSFPRVNVNLEV